MHIPTVKCYCVYSSQYYGTFSLTSDIEAVASVSRWSGEMPIKIIDVRMYFSFSKRPRSLLQGHWILSRTASPPFGLGKGQNQRQCAPPSPLPAHACPLARWWVWCPCETGNILVWDSEDSASTLYAISLLENLRKSAFSWASVSSSIKRYH